MRKKHPNVASAISVDSKHTSTQAEKEPLSAILLLEPGTREAELADLVSFLLWRYKGTAIHRCLAIGRLYNTFKRKYNRKIRKGR